MTKFRILLFSTLFVACFAISGRVFAQDQEREADYWNLVTESIALLEQETVQPEELDTLIGRWETFSQQSDQIAPERVVEQLNSGRSEEAIAEHLQMFQAIETTRETWPDTNNGTVSAAEANQQLEDMLAQDQFQFSDKANFWLWDRYQEWVIAGEDWLRGLFNRASGTGGASGSARAANTDPAVGLIGIIAAVVLGLILFQLIRQVTIGFNQEGITAQVDDESYEPLTVAEAMERADKTAESGDYRHSVRYLYLSTLLILEEKGILKPDRSLTNQEYLEVMDKHPKKAAVLRDVVTIFDRVWYGKREIDQPTLRFYQTQIRELQDEEADA